MRPRNFALYAKQNRASVHIVADFRDHYVQRTCLAEQSMQQFFFASWGRCIDVLLGTMKVRDCYVLCKSSACILAGMLDMVVTDQSLQR